ncbi:MAG: DUF3047 domain-containing protein, partial [Myxococcales bacterium]|nr:DUF3047 domain-containing protein [Myxococcales bacterium]
GLVAASCAPTLEPPPKAQQKPPPPQAMDAGVVWQAALDRPDVAALGWGSPSKASDEEIAAVFTLTKDDDHAVLHARHDGRPEPKRPPAVHFGRAFEEKEHMLADSCFLRWRWRVTQHPTQNEDAWLDLGASLYVIFDLPGLLSKGKGFKLGWLQHPPTKNGDQRGILEVPQRIDPAAGRWHDETADLCKLYREHFDGDPAEAQVLYVGVVTDADNTESIAEADYADIRLQRHPEP